MSRSDPDTFVMVRSATGAPTLDASQFNFGYEAGVDFGLTRQLNNCRDIEFRYFAVDGWNASAFAVNPTASGTIRTTPPTLFVGGPTPITFEWDSRLYSFELNVGRWLDDDVRIFVGTRVMELNEHLNGVFRSAAVFAYDVDVDNHLLGVQVGAERHLWHNGDQLRLDGFTKLGLFSNNADQNSAITQPPGIPSFGRATSRDEVGAFMVEAGVVGVYQLNSNWALRAGYQLLWLDGVALAVDQIPNTGNLGVLGVVAPATLDQSDVFYHGGSVGLEYAW
jgi:hypothetical protein